MAASLDTLQIVKRLREAGFDEPQAEALTIVFRDLRETDFADLATKADLQLLKPDIQLLKTDIERVEAKIDLRIAEIKVDIIRWVLGVAFAQAALILAALKLLPGAHS